MRTNREGTIVHFLGAGVTGKDKEKEKTIKSQMKKVASLSGQFPTDLIWGNDTKKSKANDRKWHALPVKEGTVADECSEVHTRSKKRAISANYKDNPI